MDSQSPEEWVDRFGDEPRKGADIVVQCLEREGAHRVFAYPGGASMEIHQALTRSNLVKNILCRHEQVRDCSRELAATACTFRPAHHLGKQLGHSFCLAGSVPGQNFWIMCAMCIDQRFVQCLKHLFM